MKRQNSVHLYKSPVAKATPPFSKGDLTEEQAGRTARPTKSKLPFFKGGIYNGEKIYELRSVVFNRNIILEVLY